MLIQINQTYVHCASIMHTITSHHVEDMPYFDASTLIPHIYILSCNTYTKTIFFLLFLSFFFSSVWLTLLCFCCFFWLSSSFLIAMLASHSLPRHPNGSNNAHPHHFDAIYPCQCQLHCHSDPYSFQHQS